MARHFSVATTLACPFDRARQAFDRSLFEQLISGFPPVYLERFDGIFEGAHTELRLILPFGPRWVSIITSLVDEPGHFAFTDEGRVVPPGMTAWKHVHELRATDDSHCVLEDRITLSSRTNLLEALFVRVFQSNMRARQPVYQRVFSAAAEQPLTK